MIKLKLFRLVLLLQFYYYCTRPSTASWYKERSNLLGGGEAGGSCGGLSGIAYNSFKHSLLVLLGLAYVDQLMLVVTSIPTAASTSWPLVLLEMRAQKADIRINLTSKNLNYYSWYVRFTHYLQCKEIRTKLLRKRWSPTRRLCLYGKRKCVWYASIYPNSNIYFSSLLVISLVK